MYLPEGRTASRHGAASWRDGGCRVTPHGQTQRHPRQHAEKTGPRAQKNTQVGLIVLFSLSVMIISKMQDLVLYFFISNTSFLFSF